MINPIVLFFGTAGFILTFAVHVLIWRNLRPSRHILWLGVTFIILPVAAYVILFYIALLSYSWKFMASFYNVSLIILWHIGLSGAYIMTYPTIQAECPTFKMMLAVNSFMPNGISESDMREIFSAKALLSDRIDDLIGEGLIIAKGDKFILSRKGRLLVNLFSMYRRLLGLTQGEG